MALRISSSLIKNILTTADSLKPALISLAQDIHGYAEPAFEEHKTCGRLKSFLLAEGFGLEHKLAGLDTAFRAAAGKSGRAPALGFLAEMDALPGLGHACGHNIIAASSAGAAAVLQRAMPRLKGRIEVIGCPAEESGGGKLILSRAGVFDGLAAAMIVHPANRTEVFKLSLAMVDIKLEFFGKAAHAAADPHKGINALDAVIQTFNAVNALRQQIPEEARIHGVITHGGRVPNVIPDYTSALFFARGTTREQALSMAAKVVACARGAAEATGAKLKSHVGVEGLYEPFVPHRALGRVFWDALEYLGVKIDQGPEDKELGSTDVGNVSQVAPTIHPALSVPGVKAPVHSVEFARASKSKQGMEMMTTAVKALALTGAAVLNETELRRDIKRQFSASEGKIG